MGSGRPPWTDGTTEEIVERLRKDKKLSVGTGSGVMYASAIGMIDGLASYAGGPDSWRLERIRMVLSALYEAATDE